MSMDHRLGFAPACPVARALVIAAATGLAAPLLSGTALAQTAPAPPAPKAQAPRPAAQKPPAHKPAEAAPAQAPQGQAQAQSNEQPQLIFSPWTKLWLKRRGGHAER